MRLIFSKKAELAVILSEVTVSETNGNAVEGPLQRLQQHSYEMAFSR
jgi:hypothetical protein